MLEIGGACTDIHTFGSNFSHWWRNNGTVAAVLLSADVKVRD